MMSGNNDRSDGETQSPFPRTRWSLLLTMRGAGNSKATLALDELCRLYWRPVYAYIRRRGNHPAEAEDLTQGFFAELLSRDSLASVAPEKGRFRTFLLTAVSRFMATEHDRARAQKRGGGAPHLPLACGLAEEGFVRDPGHCISPDLEFDRQWALRLLSDALDATRSDYDRMGNSALFEELRGLISLDAATDSFAAIAHRLGMSEGAVKVAAHRLRTRFRECLHAIVAATVDDEQEVDDEIRHLLTVFQSPVR